MRRLLVAILLCGCEASGEPVGRVSQATLDDRTADAVLGQVDLWTGTDPSVATQYSMHRPAGLASDPLFRKGTAATLWVADREANRGVGVYVYSSAYPQRLAGQASWNGMLANQGMTTPTQTSLSDPTAIAMGGAIASGGDGASALLAIADTGNHRVLYGGGTAFSFVASVVYGQHGDFASGNRNEGGVSWESMAEPQGVAFDGDPTNPSVTPQLYVSDTGNHRVLVFSGASTAAKLCIGQKDCDTGLPNRGDVPSAQSLNAPIGIATWNAFDLQRGFYVADSGNHRVLHFPTGSTVADAVYGQGGDFATNAPSKGGVSASSLRNPTAVALDPEGGLYVADTGHHRVLHFPKGKTVADAVYGQPDFTSSSVSPTVSPTTLRAPTGVAVTGTGDLWIADTGNSRLLRFRRPCDEKTCDDGNPCTDDRCDPTTGCTYSTPLWSKACAPYRCDSVAKNCIATCPTAVSGWCQFPSTCEGGRCVQHCTVDSECATGHCADGLCCDRACGGPCEACNLPGSAGECTPTQVGPPTAGKVCAIEVAGPCGTRCDGVDGSKCNLALKGSACGIEACVGSEMLSRGTCDGAGTCTSHATSCAPFGCSVNACRDSCRFDGDCAPGATCNLGVCTTGAAARVAGGGCGLSPAAPAPFALFALSLLGLSRRRRR